jgi:PilZ domain
MYGATGVEPSLFTQGRRYRRFKLRYPVRLLFRTDDGMSSVETFSRDVSIGGLSLHCPVFIPEHSAVQFVISLQGRSLRPIELMGEGEVVRIEPSPEEQEFSIAVACQAPITQIERYLPEAAN